MMVGECYTSFHKLLNSERSITTRNGREYEMHLVNVSEKMWYRGKYIGDLELKVAIEVPNFHKQMNVYVRTEMGTVKSSPAIINTDKQSECQELRELVISKDQIQL